MTDTMIKFHGHRQFPRAPAIRKPVLTVIKCQLKYWWFWIIY